MRRRSSQVRSAAAVQDGHTDLRAVLIWVVDAVVPKLRSRILVHGYPDWDDNVLALLSELRGRGLDATVLLQDRSSPSPAPGVTAGFRTLGKDSLRGYWYYLSAKTVFTTHGVFRSHRVPRRQTQVNMWHGEGLKRQGVWEGNRPMQASFYTSTSSVGRLLRVAQTGLAPARVLIIGAPRNDRMLTADQSAVRQLVVGDRDGRVLLWLPTFRQNTYRRDGIIDLGPLGYSAEDLQQLDDWLRARDLVLFAKPHPSASHADTSATTNFLFIDDAWLTDRQLTLSQLLAATDTLITDVSSVWHDYLLLDRPIILAFPDLDEYAATRGFVLEPFEEWVPGPTVRSMPDLISALEDAVSGGDPYAGRRAEFLRRSHLYGDALSTRRLLDFLQLGAAESHTSKAAVSKCSNPAAT